MAGHYIPFHSDFNIYSSTKHAVTAFTAALLNEMADAKRNIKITVPIIIKNTTIPIRRVTGILSNP